MLKSIESTLQNEGVKKTEILYVAVSGGADSVALLHLLNHLGYTCHVLHLNHLLRGDESEKDQQFVETLAHTLQLPITTQQTDVSALASSHSISIEMAGRKARHELFPLDLLHSVTMPMIRWKPFFYASCAAQDVAD